MWSGLDKFLYCVIWFTPNFPHKVYIISVNLVAFQYRQSNFCKKIAFKVDRAYWGRSYKSERNYRII